MAHIQAQEDGDFVSEQTTLDGKLVTFRNSVELMVHQNSAVLEGITPPSKTKLMFRYFPEEVTSASITGLFAEHGLLKEDAVLVKNVITGVRCGYGFVEFADNAGAKKAVAALDGMQLGDKRFSVFFARPPSSEESRGCLYLRDLPREWTVLDVYHKFKCFGPVISTKIILESPSLNSGKGFIRFVRKDHAMLAVSTCNGIPFGGSADPIFVCRTHRSKPTPTPLAAVMAQQVEWNLFIGNLVHGVTKQELENLIGPAQDLHSVHVTKIGTPSRPGFGFVNFTSSAGAFAMWSRLHGHEIRPGKFLLINPKSS